MKLIADSYNDYDRALIQRTLYGKPDWVVFFRDWVLFPLIMLIGWVLLWDMWGTLLLEAI